MDQFFYTRNDKIVSENWVCRIAGICIVGTHLADKQDYIYVLHFLCFSTSSCVVSLNWFSVRVYLELELTPRGRYCNTKLSFELLVTYHHLHVPLSFRYPFVVNICQVTATFSLALSTVITFMARRHVCTRVCLSCCNQHQSAVKTRFHYTTP